MPRTVVTNWGTSGATLPSYGIFLEPGKSVVLEGTVERVRAILGDSQSLRTSQASDSETATSPLDGVVLDGGEPIAGGLVIIAAGRMFWNVEATTPSAWTSPMDGIGLIGAARVDVGSYYAVLNASLSVRLFTLIPSGRAVFFDVSNNGPDSALIPDSVLSLFGTPTGQGGIVGVAGDQPLSGVQITCTDAAGAPAEADGMRVMVVLHKFKGA